MSGLYDFEIKQTLKGRIFVIFITKIGGVSIDDCAKVSRELDRILENSELINGSFQLEVSSPGLERALKQKKHYLSAINEMVKITVHHDDINETFIGKLLEVYPDYIIVEMENNKNAEINFSAIKKARTYFEFNRKERK